MTTMMIITSHIIISTFVCVCSDINNYNDPGPLHGLNLQELSYFCLISLPQPRGECCMQMEGTGAGIRHVR